MTLLSSRYSNFPYSSLSPERLLLFIQTHLNPALQCVIVRCQEPGTFSCKPKLWFLVSGRILSTNPVHAVLVMLLYSDLNLSASLNQASVWRVKSAVNIYGKENQIYSRPQGACTQRIRSLSLSANSAL